MLRLLLPRSLFHPQPLVLLFFFFFSTSLLPGRLAALSICPPCGNSTVPYPFSTADSCGDPRYQLLCNATTRTLQFPALSGTYPISRITLASRKLVIGTPQILPSTCQTSDLGSGGLLLNQSLPFNVTSSNTVFLLNCSDALLQSPLNCTSSSLCHQYAIQDPEGAACQNLRCCTFTAGGSSTSYRLHVDPQYCTAYSSVLSYNPSSQATVWSYGIELEWISPTEPACQNQTDCGLNSNSACLAASSSGVLRCLCVTGYHWDPISGLCALDAAHSHRLKKILLITGLTIGLTVLLAVVGLAFFLAKKRKAAKEAREKLTKERQKILSDNSSGKSAKLFSGKEMRSATDNFAREKLLGSGGFGDVYMGVLKEEGSKKNRLVAIKCAKIGNIKGVEQVLNEVRVLSQVNHKNLVRLLGCCVETQQPVLVYEFISNGTLGEQLQQHREGKLYLGWPTRLKIAYQTAEGLAYLHSSAVPPIYHRDVKSSNILLDDDLNARVSDFGLSRLAEPGLTHISTCAQGTLGYLDPEYYRNYQLTEKSDVYSFGVVLLELITSLKVIDLTRPEEDVNLATLVFNRSIEGDVMLVVDPSLLDETRQCEELLNLFRMTISLAQSCVEESRSSRPTMKEVAEQLNRIISTLDASFHHVWTTLNPSV